MLEVCIAPNVSIVGVSTFNIDINVSAVNILIAIDVSIVSNFIPTFIWPSLFETLQAQASGHRYLKLC